MDSLPQGLTSLPQGLTSLPNELVLLIFEFILKKTDKRQFLKTCKKYNSLTKQSFYDYENNYKTKEFYKRDKYSVEKFTLELCYDNYCEMIPERYLIPSNNVLIRELVSFNCLPLLKLAHEKGCCIKYVANYAVDNGNLEILKWARKNGFNFRSMHIIEATQNGHFEMLKWMCDNYNIEGFIENEVCYYASYHGYLNILKWAHEEGYKWNAHACSIAARNGHLECLKYLREKNCKWNHDVYLNAKQNEHWELLEWAIENGCPT